MSKRRTEGLTDNVYAFAMTLLVLNLAIPVIESGQNVESSLASALLNLWPQFWHYLLAFYVLGIYWTVHHTQLHFIEYTDRGALWLTIIYLMFITLIPFTTALGSEFGETKLAVWIVYMNIAAIGLASHYYWRHASTGNRLTKKRVGSYLAGKIRIQTLFMPFMALFSAGLVFITYPRWTFIPFFFVPLIRWRNWRIIDSLGSGDWESEKVGRKDPL